MADTVAMITGLIEPLVIDLGYELVEVQFRNESNGLVLRVIIYKEDGISLDDCSLISREVSRLLEVEDPIASAYHLEVTSPGLDRPLKTGRDFLRNMGRKIQLRYVSEGIEQTGVGIVEGVDGCEVVLSVDGAKKNIAIESVKNAQLIIEF